MQIGASLDSHDFSGVDVAAPDGNFPVGFVGGDGQVRSAKVQVLEQADGMIGKAAAKEFDVVKFGAEVAVVEHKTDAEKFKQEGDEEDRIRRIASLQGVKWRAPVDFCGEIKFGSERAGVFAGLAEAALACPGSVAVNFDSVERLATGFALRAFGADDRDAITGMAERACFLPDAAIERHRLIFDDDANVWA